MAKYIVARGQIEKGKDVVAKAGEPYTPKNTAEEKRLLSRGVIAAAKEAAKAPAGGGQKATGDGGKAAE